MDVASYPCQWSVRVFSSGGDSLKFLAGYNFRPLISEERAVFLLKRWTGVRILSTSAFSAIVNIPNVRRSAVFSGNLRSGEFHEFYETKTWHVLSDLVLRLVRHSSFQ